MGESLFVSKEGEEKREEGSTRMVFRGEDCSPLYETSRPLNIYFLRRLWRQETGETLSIESKQAASSSDIELIRAVALGDEQALASLYDRYSAILFGLLVSMLPSQDEAEEMLLEVYLDIWQNASRFDETRGSPFAWLVMLARSHATHRLRSRQPSGSKEKSAVGAEWENIPEAALDTSRSEQSNLVCRALAELDEDERRTLLLAFFAGLTPLEIATQIDTPHGTVKKQLATALMKFRESMKGMEESKNP